MNIAESGPWSLGILIGLPICIVALVGLLVLTWFLFREDFILGLMGAACIVALVGFAVSPLGFYPYKAEYHQWRDVSGTVESVDKRIISSGDSGPSDKFVVRFDTGDQFACDDTRCAQVEQGDDLTLSCKRAWQYTGTDGYDCRFVSVTR